jgi:ABC-type multidrug transport system fused ATPase/permease subunit
MSFQNENLSIIGAVKESWALTHGRFVETIAAIVMSAGSAFVLFALTAIVLGAITHLILLLFFIQPVAYALAVRGATLFAFAPAILGYHHSFASIFAQLVRENKSAGRIRGILAKKALSKNVSRSPARPKRKFAKKQRKKKRKR